jgi:MFS family permease
MALVTVVCLFKLETFQKMRFAKPRTQTLKMWRVSFIGMGAICAIMFGSFVTVVMMVTVMPEIAERHWIMILLISLPLGLFVSYKLWPPPPKGPRTPVGW